MINRQLRLLRFLDFVEAVEEDPELIRFAYCVPANEVFIWLRNFSAFFFAVAAL